MLIFELLLVCEIQECLLNHMIMNEKDNLLHQLHKNIDLKDTGVPNLTPI